MIRRATVADLPALEPLACEFYASSAILKRFDMARFVNLWTQLLAGPAAIFVAEQNGVIVGALGGVMYPDTYSDEMIATEFFWFVLQAHRGDGMRLYKAFEQWGKDSGAKQLRMVHLADSEPDRLRMLYGRLGYTPAEMHYMKEVA